MKKQIALFSIMAAALIAVPAISHAADKNKDAPAAADSAKKQILPFHGKISAVDTTAATITIGKMTINITSETKITKDGKPATVADLAVGDMAGGAYKKDDASKKNATVIHVGEKAAKEGKKKTE